MSRPIGVNLAPQQREWIKQLYLQGHSTKQIAEHFGVNKSTVTRITLKAGLRDKLETAGRRLSKEEIAEIKKLYTSTLLSKGIIANKLSISVDSVNYHTAGLLRAVPDSIIDEFVAEYLTGQITAEQVKEKTGLTKQAFYKEVTRRLKHV